MRILTILLCTVVGANSLLSLGRLFSFLRFRSSTVLKYEAKLQCQIAPENYCFHVKFFFYIPALSGKRQFEYISKTHFSCSTSSQVHVYAEHEAVLPKEDHKIFASVIHNCSSAMDGVPVEYTILRHLPIEKVEEVELYNNGIPPNIQKTTTASPATTGPTTTTPPPTTPAYGKWLWVWWDESIF